LPHPLRKLGKEAENDEPEPGDLIAYRPYSRWMGGGDLLVKPFRYLKGYYLSGFQAPHFYKWGRFFVNFRWSRIPICCPRWSALADRVYY